MFRELRKGGPSSLSARLFISATVLVVVILFVTGIALSSLYQQAVERSFDRRLNLYLRTLIAEVAPPEDADDKAQPALGEPLFELPLSGWYWQIVRIDDGKRADPSKPDERASRSLWDQQAAEARGQGHSARPDRRADRLHPGAGGPAAARRRAAGRFRLGRPLHRHRRGRRDAKSSRKRVHSISTCPRLSWR